MKTGEEWEFKNHRGMAIERGGERMGKGDERRGEGKGSERKGEKSE